MTVVAQSSVAQKNLPKRLSPNWFFAQPSAPRYGAVEIVGVIIIIIIVSYRTVMFPAYLVEVQVPGDQGEFYATVIKVK